MSSFIRFLRSPYRGRTITQLLKVIGWSYDQILGLDFYFSNSNRRYEIQDLGITSPKLFAYVKHGKIDSFDLELIDFFRKNGFFCILCSNQPLDSRIADFWIEKNRFGRDSSLLRDLTRNFENLSMGSFEFAFFNDSMIWDSEELPKLLVRLRSFDENAVVFPTESNNPRNHVQPYLLYVRLNREGLQRFSQSFLWIKTLHFKRGLVKFIEYIFREKIEALGWEVQVLVKHRDLFDSDLEAMAGRRINPNQHAWERLPRLGLVGVKRSLIKSNPVGVANAPKSIEEALRILQTLKNP